MDSWSGGGTPRRSISTVTAPNEVSRFYMNNFPGRPPPQFRTPYSNEQGHHYPPDTPQQPHRYFRDDSSTMVSSQSSFATTNNDATPPMFDPRRFSPPQLDTPPANQESRSFSFDSWNGNGPCSSRVGNVNGNGSIPSSGPLTDPIINTKHESFSQCQSFSSPCTEIGQGIAQISFPNYDSKTGIREGFNHGPPPQQSHVHPYHRMSDISGESMVSPHSSVKMEEDVQSNKKRRSNSVCVRKLSEMAMKSQLRSARFSTVQTPSLTPYTPPPILSPRRSGTGLYCQLTKDPSKE
ncbi:hypothetical protein PRIPAC_70019, partial [Pristionchus pacificus]|uniref:Uncharacterized protein n=1 Tax=Pristionchus pacificus TaxID=54126 RepID=A0A2A6C9K3_PRIPA